MTNGAVVSLVLPRTKNVVSGFTSVKTGVLPTNRRMLRGPGTAPAGMVMVPVAPVPPELITTLPKVMSGSTTGPLSTLTLVTAFRFVPVATNVNELPAGLALGETPVSVGALLLVI